MAGGEPRRAVATTELGAMAEPGHGPHEAVRRLLHVQLPGVPEGQGLADKYVLSATSYIENKVGLMIFLSP